MAMNTISNQKALKARLSAGWSHDARQYRFERQHKGPAFESGKKVSVGEGIAWAAAFAGLIGFCALVLSLA